AGSAPAVEFRAGRTVQQRVEEQGRRTPDAIAVRFDDESLSYAELDTRGDLLARQLRRVGVGPEVLVGICAERSPELVVGLLAILKAGGAYVPLDPEYPAERLRLMLEDSGALVLVTQSSLLDRIPDRHGAQVVCVDHAEIGTAAAPPVRTRVGPPDP